MSRQIDEFISKNTSTERPKGCPFNIGDNVSFTNDYGVKFTGRKVVGFNRDDNFMKDRPVYIDYDCYWFPCKIESLSLE